MAGIEAGKTWSRIGAEVAPTSSAASGVWGDLNEVAENVGAGTWPAPPDAWEVISTTVTDTTAATYNLTSIPQTYRDLRLVVSAARTSAFGDRFYVYVDVGSGVDTDVADYGTRRVSSSGSSSGTMDVVSFSNVPGYATDFPGQSDTGVGMSAIWDFMDYTNTAKLPTAIGWQNGTGQGTVSFYHVHGGWMYDVVGAVQGLQITRPTTTSNYYFKEPTTFTLFGRGAP
jgi:hypothetical protein|tara:strand:- start:18335 stop:19018 length:684 start_codon:yes stop_codon:yes gene_type:complete